MAEVQQRVLASMQKARDNQSPVELQAAFAQLRDLSQGHPQDSKFVSQALVKCAEAGLLLLRNIESKSENVITRKEKEVDLAELCSESLSLYFTFNPDCQQPPIPLAQSNSKGATPTPPHNPGRNQFVSRAYYAQAQLAERRCKGLKGAQLKEAVLAAVELVLKGIRIAQEDGARHAFLVYNGSVHHWRITRVLNREGVRSALLPSFESVTKALQWTSEQGVQQEDWRAQNLLALAWCLADAGSKERAISAAQECERIAKGGPLLAAAVALRTHLSMAGKPAASSGKSKGEGGKDVEVQARSILQTVRSSTLLAAPSDAKKRVSSDTGDLEKQLLDAWRLVDPRGASLVASSSHEEMKAAAESIKSVNTDVVADVAWASALTGAEKVAERAAKRAAQGRSLGARARAELTLCKIALDKETSELLSSADLDPSAIARRADVIRRAEGSLSSFLRVNDASGVDDACRLIWNASLPLIDPTNRHVATRALRAAAAALSAVGSGMHRLRARIHLELSEIHHSEEMLSKAEDETSRGLELDYEATPTEVEAAGCERPLDRHLEPLLRRIQLKRDLYNDPDRPMDKALMLIEQARDAKKALVKGELLSKAAAELEAAETEARAERARAREEEERQRQSRPSAESPPVEKGSKVGKGKKEAPSKEATPEPGVKRDPTFEKIREIERETAKLWGSAVRIAVEAKLYKQAHSFADKILAGEWSAARDKEMVILQAEVAFLDSEACIGLLREKGLELLPPDEKQESVNAPEKERSSDSRLETETSMVGEMSRKASEGGQLGIDDLEEATSSTEKSFDARACQERAYMGFVEGAKKGLATNEAWLMTNAAANLWNNYLPLLKSKRYGPLVNVFNPILDVLLTLPLTALLKDALTISNIANALASGHVHRYLERVFRNRSVSGKETPTEPEQAAKRGPSPKLGSKKEKAAPLQERPPPESKPPEESVSDVAPHDPSDEGRSYTELILWALEPGRKRCEHAPELLSAAEVCSKVLEKLQSVDESVIKTVVGTQAKVQGLRGLPQGDQSLGASAKAVGLIELASNAGESASARTKAILDAADALQKATGKGEKATGVNLELWTKLARAALALGELQTAISCSRSAREVAQKHGEKGTPGDKENVPPKTKPPTAYHYYWLSLAESTEGRATSQLINPAKQSPAAQDALRVKALEKFLEAVKCGAKAGKADLMCQAALLWWNTALPLTKEAPGRSLLSATCQPVLEALLGAPARALPPDVYASLFLLLLDCLAEQEQWGLGLEWTDLAVRNTVPSQHKHFWALKTKFMVKMGRSLSDELERASDKDGEVRARMWATLANQSGDEFERLKAHHSAIVALEETPWLQIPYMLSYAEYLAAEGYPSTDSEDVLLCAADILHDLAEEEDEEEADGEGGPRSRMGGGSIASGSQQNGNRRSTVNSSRQGSGSIAGRSAVGGASLHGSRASLKKRASLLESGSQASGLRKGSVVGKSTIKSGITSASASVPSVPLPESKRLKYLLRIYTALAKTSASLEDRTENALLAHHFGERFLKHVLAEINARVAEKRAALAEVAAAAVHEESRLSRSLSKSVGSAVTTRPSRLGGSIPSANPTPPEAEQPPPIAMPSANLDWTRVDLVDQIKGGLKLDRELEAALVKAVKALGLSAAARSGGSKNKINGSDLYRQLAKKIKGLDALLQEESSAKDPVQEAIDDPPGLLNTLETLEGYLEQAGLHALTIPLRQLALSIADVSMGRADVVLAERLAMVTSLETLALRSEAAEWEKGLGVLVIPPEERKKAREEIEQRMEVRRLAALKNSEEGHQTSDNSQPVASEEERSRKSKRVQDQHEMKRVSNSTSNGQDKRLKADRPNAPPFHERHAWLAAGAFLIERGLVEAARAHLTEAREHARVFDDTHCAAACALHLARLTLLENKHEAAVSILQEVVSIGGDAFEWVERATLAAQIWQEDLPRGSGFSKARGVLRAGADRFEALLRRAQTPNPSQKKHESTAAKHSGGTSLDAGVAEATLLQELAAVMMSESRHLLRVGEKVRAEKVAREAVETMQLCCNRWRDLGAQTALVTACLAHVAALDWLQRARATELPGTRPPSRVDAPEALASAKETAEMQRKILLEALEEGKKTLTLFRGAGTWPAMTSLPLERQLAQVLELLANAELALAEGAAVDDAAAAGAFGLTFPLVEGRDADGVRKYLEESDELGPAAVQRRRQANKEQSHEERAVLYASEALSLLGEQSSLCHVPSLQCTLGTCLLRHSEREARLEEKKHEIARRKSEPNGKEPLKSLSGAVPEAGPSFPLGVPQADNLFTRDEDPGSLDGQAKSAESELLEEPKDKTGANRAVVLGPEEIASPNPTSEASKRVTLLECQGVNALEKAITDGLKYSSYENVYQAALTLGAFYLKKRSKDSPIKAAEYISLAHSCKARAFLLGVFEVACAQDDVQKLAYRRLRWVREKGLAERAADYRTVQRAPNDVDVTSAEAALRKASPCAWGLLESVKNQAFADAIRRLPLDSGVLILHYDEEASALFAVAIGAMPSEDDSKDNGKGKSGANLKRKTSKSGKEKGKEDAATKSESSTPKPLSKERTILVQRTDARELLNLAQAFDAWGVQAMRALARAHAPPAKEDVGAEFGKGTPAPGKGSAPGEAKSGQPPAAKSGSEKASRASSRTGKKAPSRPVSRLQPRPLDDELDSNWTALIDRMAALLEPLSGVLDAATGCGKSADTIVAPDNAVAAPAARPKHLVLVLHPTLASLPLEALQELKPLPSVSRDFSLTVFAHRLAQNPQILDLKKLCYIVDPRNEDTERSTRLPTRATPPLAESFSEIAQKEWKGLMGSDRIPSDGEIQRLVFSSSALVFMGLGKMLASVGASALAALDLSSCRVAVLAGGSVSDESLRRQAFLDNRKSFEEKELERPHATAALLTLCGVSSIGINKTVSTVDANHSAVSALFQCLSSQPSVTLGEAVKDASSKVDATEMRHLSSNMVLYGLPC